jgi:hypothetical protein
MDSYLLLLRASLTSLSSLWKERDEEIGCSNEQLTRKF